MNILQARLRTDQAPEYPADAGAAAIAIGTLAQVLPSIAALLTIVWLLIRIWESDTARWLTGRSLLGRRDDAE
jgi:hypothetical protein